jgi:hypothetical protein
MACLRVCGQDLIAQWSPWGHHGYVTIAIAAFVVGPLVCWLVVASTPRVRLTVGIVLAVCSIGEFAAWNGWLFPRATHSALVMLALATVVTLVTGIVIEERQEGAVPFRYARLHVRIGTLLSGAFSFLTIAAIAFFMFGVWAFGPPASTPSSDSVLPMPSNLILIANVDHGCGGSSGPQLVCSREIDLRLPGASRGGGGHQARGLPDQEQAFGVAAADLAAGRMMQAYGWHLTPGSGGAWHSCRSVGWWLDKHTVCATITVKNATAVVIVDVAADW